ncbi:MAG: hypothetical protein KDA89_05185 [Planctomycetaceae bacterium]|nr:hypothetical protein [Planctomycetaceae bacterium]
MTAADSDILDDLFHSCAFRAFVEVAIESGRLPCVERTKYRAYQHYETDLAAKNAGKNRSLSPGLPASAA